jgi:CubicO group peptidase (beta-lactamase class C family)
MKDDAGRSPNEQITIEHLLTHTTGAWAHGVHDPLRLNAQMTHWELIAWTVEHMRLTRAPGDSFAYSNFGYCILGRVIEKLTGQTYEHYIKENILTRCGIVDMQIAGNALRDRAANEVKYYSSVDPYWRNLAREDACGGVDRDTERFDEVLCPHRRLQGYGPTAFRRGPAYDDYHDRRESPLCERPLCRFTK